MQLQLVFHAFPEWDPAFPALATLMRLLDDGMSTPLHYRVCDQKGLAYHVSAGLEPLHDAALVEIDAACSPENLAPLVAEILSILRELPTMPVPAAELEKAKRRYIGDLEAGFDDLDGLCGWFGGTELFFRPYSHVERARRVQRVTAEDVQAVAAPGVLAQAADGGGGGPGQARAADRAPRSAPACSADRSKRRRAARRRPAASGLAATSSWPAGRLPRPPRPPGSPSP